jgi:DNA-binding response OmpR family regulator
VKYAIAVGGAMEGERGKAAILVARDLRERVLLRAQLIEEGVNTVAVPDMEGAAEWLSDASTTPLLLIYDCKGQERLREDLGVLSLLRGAPPVLILASTSDGSLQEAEGMGFRHILTRPVSIGKVAERARLLIGGKK